MNQIGFANSAMRQCSLLLFVSTPTEEQELENVVRKHDLLFEKNKHPTLGEYHWLGTVGHETVIAIRPVRDRGQVVMGEMGRLGSAARGIQFREATGAIGIVQVGMAFGIDSTSQKLGDVLVATSLIPYDNRIVRAAHPNYITDYSQATRQDARPALVALFGRERKRGKHSFGVHMGAILSGAARIQSRIFRDELVMGVPDGEDAIVGGEMESVGLLAATTSADDPIWCVVKGISDFADENRDTTIATARPLACRNAAEFVLSALLNDVIN